MVGPIAGLVAFGSSLPAAWGVALGLPSPAAFAPPLPAASTAAIEAQRVLPWLLQSDSGNDEGDLFILALLGFFAGLYLIYDGFDTWKLGRLVQDTPTSNVRSMPVGRVELEGTVRKRDGSVTPPLSDAECVYVSWKAEKREKRVDDDGDVHYTWNTIGAGTRAFQFDLEDDTGAVRIRADVDDPEFDVNADDHSLRRTYGRGESAPTAVRRFVRGGGDPTTVSLEDDDDGGLVDGVLDFASDLATDSLSDTGNRRRYSETVLPVGSHVYVLGGAEPREGTRMEASQADLLEVREDPGSGEFIVSDSREEELQDSYSKWGPLKTLGGLVLSTGCLFVLLWKYRLHELVI